MKNRSVRYSVNENNGLVIEISEDRLTPNGSFSIDDRNRLVYWLNEPQAWERKYSIPGKIVFEGNWSLNTNHDLELEINRDSPRFSGTVPSGTLVLKGKIISAEPNKLAFEVVSYENQAKQKPSSTGAVPVSIIRILALSGSWGCDETNQVFFTLTKNYAQDTFKFKSGWSLNQNQQIVYTYQKTNLKTKTKSSSEFTIEGFWEVTSANRLRYIISSGTGSKFDFKVQLETPTIYPKDGEIRYRLGAGVKRRKGLSPKGTIPNIVCLYGAWKLSRALGLTFEMEYAKKEMHSLSFDAEVNFDANNQVTLNLKDKNVTHAPARRAKPKDSLK